MITPTRGFEGPGQSTVRIETCGVFRRESDARPGAPRGPRRRCPMVADCPARGQGHPPRERTRAGNEAPPVPEEGSPAPAPPPPPDCHGRPSPPPLPEGPSPGPVTPSSSPSSPWSGWPGPTATSRSWSLTGSGPTWRTSATSRRAPWRSLESWLRPIAPPRPRRWPELRAGSASVAERIPGSRAALAGSAGCGAGPRPGERRGPAGPPRGGCGLLEGFEELLGVLGGESARVLLEGECPPAPDRTGDAEDEDGQPEPVDVHRLRRHPGRPPGELRGQVLALLAGAPPRSPGDAGAHGSSPPTPTGSGSSGAPAAGGGGATGSNGLPRGLGGAATWRAPSSSSRRWRTET
jgi:hypothetical protein